MTVSGQSSVCQYPLSVAVLIVPWQIWWIGPNGSVQSAFWYEGFVAWKYYELDGPGSALTGITRTRTLAICAASSNPDHMEVWWVTPEGTLKSAYFYEGGHWNTYTMPNRPNPTAPDSHGTRGLAVLTRRADTMEVFSTAPSGAVEDHFIYGPTGPWVNFMLAAPGSCSPGAITGVSRKSETMEVGMCEFTYPGSLKV
eukprot:jgi/Chrzof1/11500/UNPLg00432.t1